MTTLPLTAAQREIWYGNQLGQEVSCSFNQSALLTLRGPLDIGRLTEAFRTLMDRHEALRVTFARDGSAQFLHDSMTLRLEITDLSSLPAETRQHQMDQHARNHVEHPFDLVQGPLFRFEIMKLGPEEHTLILTVHHIVCDGGSLGVLLQELSEEYERMERTTDAAQSYREFILEEVERARSAGYAQAEEFWVGQYGRPAAALALPLDRPRPARRTYSASSTSVVSHK